TESRRNAVPRDGRADDHRGEGEIRRDEPGQVRIDAEQDSHTVQIEQKCEGEGKKRVKPEERREAEEDAQGEGRSRSLRRVVDVEERAEPPAAKGARQVNHRKWPYPAGRGMSATDSPEPHRSTTARSSVHTPIRVRGTPPWRAAAESRRRVRGLTAKRSS